MYSKRGKTVLGAFGYGDPCLSLLHPRGENKQKPRLFDYPIRIDAISSENQLIKEITRKTLPTNHRVHIKLLKWVPGNHYVQFKSLPVPRFTKKKTPTFFPYLVPHADESKRDWFRKKPFQVRLWPSLSTFWALAFQKFPTHFFPYLAPHADESRPNSFANSSLSS